MARRAYSYTRISTGGRQARGDGLARQARWAEELCKAEGWQLDDTLLYVDMASGFHRHNLKPTAAFARFLKDVEEKRVLPGSVLILENLDRLTRADLDEAFDLFRGVLKSGVWIATKEPRRIYTKADLANVLALFEPLLIMARGHEESKIKSVRVAAAWESSRVQVAEGKPHQCRPPAWIAKRSGGYVLLADRAAIVRRVFMMAARGMGGWRIAKQLNAEGVPYLGRKEAWGQYRVARLLRSRAALGEYQPHKRDGKLRVPTGAPIEDYYPRVVSESEWQAAQRAIDSRRHSRGRPPVHRVNIFTGLVREAETGNTFMMRPVQCKDELVSFLTTRQPCGPRLRYDLFERTILAAVDQLKLADVLSAPGQLSEAQQRLSLARAKHTALMQRRRHIQSMLADPDFDADDLAPALADNGNLLRAAEEELQRAQWAVDSGRADALASLQSLHDAMLEASGEELEELRQRTKEALPSVIESIEVRPIGPIRRGARYLATVRLRGGTERLVEVESSVRFK